jgi:hypothetical protein
VDDDWVKRFEQRKTEEGRPFKERYPELTSFFRLVLVMLGLAVFAGVVYALRHYF